MRANATSSTPTQLCALRHLSARLGANPLLVQANTGNTSVKVANYLWIKASGKWLIDADSDDFLVAVDLLRARRCLHANTPIPETKASPGASIETAMHVALPHTVVVHVHSVNAIAWAVREDAPRQLATRLGGLAWQWIPYTPSGVPLARQISQALSAAPATDIFVLGNHGLVVCGETCHAAEALLAQVEDRLAVEPRPAPPHHPPALQPLLSGSEWCLPPSSALHSLASDPISRRIFARGVLFPCQALFLSGREGELFQFFENQGVLCSKHITPAEQQALSGLCDVIRRIEPAAPLRYLTRSELAAVSA